ncbi:NUDIX domain-containing protein [Nocardioides sp. Kera G14]|uniref:NUDIX domain-containing protein n=1 Tax=Nocardioides sp. Kera G14 TaxID=2884264 RepID=UPI001D11A515|nr:NUDIX domain-containing protein [Nocardioides sp. Kera G14]UDY24139.1 NUDIX domain-containing protein [Nocardioides sp. Kera G14]
MTPNRFVVVPAAYLYLLRDAPEGGTEVLLQRRGPGVPYMADHWAAAAAGHVERGETAFAAALREAHEELGLTDIDLEFVTTMHRTRGGEAIDERVDFFFTARAWVGEPAIQEPDKASELGWFDLESLPSPMVPHEAAALALLAVGDVPAYVAHGF